MSLTDSIARRLRGLGWLLAISAALRSISLCRVRSSLVECASTAPSLKLLGVGYRHGADMRRRISSAKFGTPALVSSSARSCGVRRGWRV